MIDIVNGYVCNNCSDVALAKRDINPAHPKDGPAGQNKSTDPTGIDRNRAVTFGGALARNADNSDASSQAAASSSPTVARAGSVLNIAA